MHTHLEVIMPAVDNIEKALTEILSPFDESGVDEDGGPNRHPFWDYWTIGGRWSGDKAKSRLDKQQIEAFFNWCREEKITVSGVTAGKQSLSPSSQIPKVDAKWAEMFPAYAGKPCPLFKHSGDENDGDVLPVSELTGKETCARVIVAGPACAEDGLGAEYMLETKYWNGVTWCESKWDGTIKSALDCHREHIDRYSEEYKAKCAVQPDWLVVTVDYHS